MSFTFHHSTTFQFGLGRLRGLPTLQKPQPLASLWQVALREEAGLWWLVSISPGRVEDGCASWVERDEVGLDTIDLKCSRLWM